MVETTDPVFTVLRSSGPDPVRDPVFHLEAAAFVGGERREILPRTFLRPPGSDAGALAPPLREAGLGPEEAALLPDAAGGLAERLAPLAGRLVVLGAGGQELASRFARLLPGEPGPVPVALEDLAAFLLPRRGERGLAALLDCFLGRPLPAVPRPEDLRDLLAALAAAHFAREPALRQLFSRGLDDLQLQAQGSAPDAWEWCEALRRLLDRPSLYLSPGTGLEDGGFSADLEAAPLETERLLPAITPRFARDYAERFAPYQPLETRQEAAAGLDPEHRRFLDGFFDRLPRHFQGGEEEAALRPERPGQRALANAVEQALAEQAFLIADAPTGTGKTLAYLAPLLLWAQQNQVRVGVSTYTRALQEQAFFREIPRAMEILCAAGVSRAALPRVSLHKGRANYLCGRALADSMPEPGEGSLAARATWLRLALYYCEDPLGDLDGFGALPGPPLGSRPRVLRQARAMLATVRALPRCCSGKAALRCAAAVRGMRSERSHLVVTNHAFVLARPEFFSHLVFDECDHLHEVTVSARSYDMDLEEAAALGQDLLRGRGRDRAPFERLARFVSRLPLGDLPASLRDTAARSGRAAAGLEAAARDVARRLRAYLAWRQESAGDLTPEERAFLLHDFLESGRGDALATSLRAMRTAVDTLDSGLRTIIEDLGDLPQRRARRICWSLRRPLDLLDHWREGLDRWLGGEGGEADFSEDLHYEAVFDPRHMPMLVLKWLLPQKWLGEVYYPSLSSAVLLSATARIRNSFKPMKGYLGLDIVEQGTAGKPAREVREFSGPPTFDARAALVCVPEDAPPYGYGGERLQAWLDYVEDFLLFLAERTRGRILGLFTNRRALQRVGERLTPLFAARGIPLLWQGMPAAGKEEIMERFRGEVDSVLLGLDTFWYGVDFPGETCQYVVVTKLPYGQLDDYLYAQRARMGAGPHRNRIYLPKALAMFRQGCGRLLRNEDDRGVVFILDRRVLEKRHADFLAELPGGLEEFDEPNLLVSDSDACFQEAFRHMRLAHELQRLGLAGDFSSRRRDLRAEECEG